MPKRRDPNEIVVEPSAEPPLAVVPQADLIALPAPNSPEIPTDDDDPLPRLRPTTSLFLGGEGRAIIMTWEQEQFAQNNLTEKQRHFLYAYCLNGTVVGASESLISDVTGRPVISTRQHEKWLAKKPEYRLLFDELHKDVEARWERRLWEAADKGLIEDSYSVDGQGVHTLKSRRVRQDGNLLLKVTGALLPQYREDKGGGQTTIVIVRTQE